MSWRYQPVWIMAPAYGGAKEKLYILIEVFFNDDGKLDGWTTYEKERRYEPMGDTQDELVRDLEIQLKDAKKWKAVEYDKIEVGMEFEKRGEKNEVPDPKFSLTDDDDWRDRARNVYRDYGKLNKVEVEAAKTYIKALEDKVDALEHKLSGAFKSLQMWVAKENK